LAPRGGRLLAVEEEEDAMDEWKARLDVFWKVGSDYHVKLEGNEDAYLGWLSVACLYRGNSPKDYREL
jgi:hypothetical protein